MIYLFIYLFIVFNATFSYIMATSFSGGGNHGQATGKLSIVAASRVHPFCNLQSRARILGILAVLVKGCMNCSVIQLPNSLSNPGPLIIGELNPRIIALSSDSFNHRP
jgi:hypothetical protein